ncbi:MAG: hypothetical protein U0528_20970 [Anaerolineae bacterium]|nr:hypothetical protein [Anaerolineae bacterium]
MPIKQEVQADGRLMYWEIADPWSMDDLIPKIDAVNQFINESSEPIYSFVDLRQAKELPRGIASIHKIRHWNWSPQAGAEVILVISSAAVKAMIQLLFRLARSQRAVIFDDYAAAWDYTQQLLQQGSAQQENKAGS